MKKLSMNDFVGLLGLSEFDAETDFVIVDAEDMEKRLSEYVGSALDCGCAIPDLPDFTETVSTYRVVCGHNVSETLISEPDVLLGAMVLMVVTHWDKVGSHNFAFMVTLENGANVAISNTQFGMQFEWGTCEHKSQSLTLDDGEFVVPISHVSMPLEQWTYMQHLAAKRRQTESEDETGL